MHVRVCVRVKICYIYNLVYASITVFYPVVAATAPAAYSILGT